MFRARTSVRAVAVAVAAVAVTAVLPAPASADPNDNPCGASLLCRLLPIAPDLEGDIDLTKPQPAADPALPPPPDGVSGGIG